MCSNTQPAAIDDDSRAAADLAEMAERAARRGLRVGYEALSWGRHVKLWGHAWRIVSRAGQPALGLIVDSFHTLSLGDDPSGIARVPADKLFFVQMADAPRLSMDVLSWSRHFRNFPGQGDLDVTGFMRAVLASGYAGPLSLEVFNDEFRAAPARLVARDGLRSLILTEAAATDATSLPAAPVLDGVETSNEIALYYDITGEGPTVCLINGYRLSSAAWPPSFIARLAERCSVMVFDNRGTGQSDKPDTGYEIGNLARDVIGLLDELQLPRIHLFGFSMGGAIAQEIAIRYPDRIDHLVLFGTFCGGIWAEPASHAVFRRLLVTGSQSPEEAARQAWPVTYSPEYLAANAEAVERQMRRELEHPTPMFVGQRQMEALRSFDSYRELPKIGAVTLVATGTHDELVKPRNSEILASRILNSRLEMLADLGHRAIWEAPEEIADMISDFLTGPAGRTRP